MGAKFEHIKGYEDVPLPVRATGGAAGYDFFIAEDIVIPSFWDLKNDALFQYSMEFDDASPTLTLDETASIIKSAGGKLTLVPTGIKCKLEPGTYLELSVRSSTPLKNWLILANGVGIIDADYWGNPDNDGHIYFQLINLCPWDIQLKKGDRIGQGIIKAYLTTEDDNCTGTNREGGFGSSKQSALQALKAYLKDDIDE